jgi:hypothetical protein
LVLFALATYLCLTYGSAAWGDYQALVNGQAMLRASEGLGEGVAIDQRAYVLRNVKRSATAWETYVQADDQMDRDVGGISVAMIALVLGISGVLRNARTAPIDGFYSWDRRDVTHKNVWLSLVDAAWSMAEPLGLSFLRMLLVGYGYVVTTQILGGEQLSTPLATDGLNRTLDVLVGVIRTLQ